MRTVILRRSNAETHKTKPGFPGDRGLPFVKRQKVPAGNQQAGSHVQQIERS